VVGITQQSSPLKSLQKLGYVARPILPGKLPLDFNDQPLQQSSVAQLHDHCARLIKHDHAFWKNDLVL
jgi:hypothetical protein